MPALGLQPADQESHVGTLAASERVHFIEGQKFQVLEDGPLEVIVASSGQKQF
jgi:hypothetical protein